MTFTEAALEVLRSVGKPLHYKKITELAIERNLLSHVGKTPEVTMSSRLATMVKKDRGEAPIVKLRPGVFGLRDEAKAANGKDTPEHVASASVPPEQAEEQSPTSTVPPKLPGADVFPEEEDDDELILAGLDEEERSAREGKRRRKRRRRRSKGGEDGPPSAAGPSQPPPKPSASKGPPKAPPKPAKLRAPAPADLSREPAEGDLLGKDLADAAYAVLHKAGHKPQTFADVAERLVHRGRLSGDAATLAPTIAAAVRADVATRERMSARPRFRVRDGLVGLIDWYLPKEMVWAEDAAMDAVERQRDQARREVLRRLRDLPPAGFAELMATWLNAEGVVALRAVRRPTSSATEMHFAGTLKRGSEETRLAIMIRRDGKSLDRERVVEMRGSMHHYGQASACWLISTGSLLSGARDEVEAAGAAPCALFDGSALVEAMERRGIGVRRQLVPLIGLDLELFEALGGNSPVIGTAAAPAGEADEAAPGRDKGKKRRSTRGERARAGAEQRPRRKQEPGEAREEAEEASAKATSDEAASGTEPEDAAASADTAEAEQQVEHQPPRTPTESAESTAGRDEAESVAQASAAGEEAEPPAPKRPARRRTRRREPRATATETAEAEESASAGEESASAGQATASTHAPAEATEAEAGATSTEDDTASSATEASAEDTAAVRPIPTVTLENPPSGAPREEPEALERSREAGAEPASDQPEEGTTEAAEKASNDREGDEEQ